MRIVVRAVIAQVIFTSLPGYAPASTMTYDGLHIGMSMAEVEQAKGVPHRVAKEIPFDANVHWLPAQGKHRDFRVWEYVLGFEAIETVEFDGSGNLSGVMCGGAMDAREKCPPLGNTRVEDDEAVIKSRLGDASSTWVLEADPDGTQVIDYSPLDAAFMVGRKKVVAVILAHDSKRLFVPPQQTMKPPK